LFPPVITHITHRTNHHTTLKATLKTQNYKKKSGTHIIHY